MNGFEAAMAGGAQQAPQPEMDQKGFQPAGQDGTPATPEQQAQYNKFVAMALLALYDDKFMPKAQAMLEKSPNVVDGMASLATAIVSRIYMAAKQQGSDIPPEVVLHGGYEIMAEIGEFANAIGIQGVGEEQVENAYYLAADKFRSTLDANGMLDKEQLSKDFEGMRADYGEDAFGQLVERVRGVQQQTAESMMPKRQMEGAQQ